jgi:hypothetical protein
MLENIEGTLKHGQSRETGNLGYKRRRQTNVREYRRDTQTWTIQRNWQPRVQKTKTNKTTTKHNMSSYNDTCPFFVVVSIL